jgi:hypothetical protein
LSSRFIGPFEILEKVGVVAYRLALLPDLSSIHVVFHVLMLRKHLSDSFHELEVQPVELREDISYEVQSVEIMDRKGGKL